MMAHFVICDECGDEHDAEEVQFLNIEEDMQGRDVVFFTCPNTGGEAKSLVYKGYAE